MKPSVFYRTGVLVCVAAVHVGALWLMLSRLPQPAVTPPVPLKVVVAEILPATRPAVEAPRPLPESKPQPVQQPKPQAKPKPAHKTEPPKEHSVPKTAHSEQATKAPQPSESAAAPAPATPAEAAPATPSAPPAPPAPLTPPRFNAAYLNNPPPAYPPILRRAGEEGRVVLRVFVTAEGTAGEVRVLTPSSSPLFDEAALAAVRKWRFVPGRRGDTPVAEWVQVPIEFKLN